MSKNYLPEKPIIAVTGSSGKTTVKAMISAILREKWIIFESRDYYNTTVNTPQHKEAIRPIHRAVVLEYGMGFAGQIAEHCSILQPAIAVITNVGSAHIGNFDGKVESLAAAKSEVIKGMHPEGYLFINKDDQNSKLLHTKDFKGKITTVGISFPADYQAKNISFTKDGIEFDVISHRINDRFYIPVIGKHNIYNALFAIAVADLLGFSPIEMKNGLKYIKKPEHRLHLYRLKDDIIVIDDTVHAHPPAMKAALDVLLEVGKKKKIAVLGSMGELGVLMEEAHREIGAYAASKNVDAIYTFGNYSSHTHEGAIAAGYPKEKAMHFYNLQRKKLHEELLKIIEPGTTVLVKGASKQKLFEVVQFLVDNFSK
ncbi:UDP-N-acetylmuramoyl-tripeptide--D-alanyl-D-alanine ligase [Calidifontibacillus oryziterrae]|uniref:UDP-N-acetylmuramoyl-tripeptide--D-alanyl-D- alanine ligase n=1 Tax=Calidifontibacillus oryziterrae TaxID=1191699 RepID=UPI0002F8684B|nr:UDP-N-acetylmuramoyl-tripeptide--D-alanyl-D-alanine ligase [Calidifontibacillus oryziterrae]